VAAAGSMVLECIGRQPPAFALVQLSRNVALASSNGGAWRHHAGNPDHLNDGPEPAQLRRRAGRGIFVDAPDRPAILIEGPVLAIGLRRRCEAGWAMSRGANR
jgi:hypothetical protein